MLRPPSNPRPLAPLPEHLADRGRRPRTPAPVRARRSGAPLWSPPTSRRQTSSPSARRTPSGSPTSGSWPTRSPAASESHISTPSSASRSPRRAGCRTDPRLHPARGRLRGLPAGISRAAGAGCKQPPAPQPSPGISPDSGAAFPEEKGGCLQPRRHATETQPIQRVPTTATSERHEHKCERKGGLGVSRPKAAPNMPPARANRLRDSGRWRAWSGTPGRPAIPARMTRRDRRGRPTLTPGGDGRPHRGATGRRSQVRYVPAPALAGGGSRTRTPPPGAFGGARGSRRYPLRSGVSGRLRMCRLMSCSVSGDHV